GVQDSALRARLLARLAVAVAACPSQMRSSNAPEKILVSTQYVSGGSVGRDHNFGAFDAQVVHQGSKLAVDTRNLVVSRAPEMVCELSASAIRATWLVHKPFGPVARCARRL